MVRANVSTPQGSLLGVSTNRQRAPVAAPASGNDVEEMIRVSDAAVIAG